MGSSPGWWATTVATYCPSRPGTSKILVDKTSPMTGRLRVYRTCATEHVRSVLCSQLKSLGLQLLARESGSPSLGEVTQTAISYSDMTFCKLSRFLPATIQCLSVLIESGMRGSDGDKFQYSIFRIARSAVCLLFEQCTESRKDVLMGG